MDGFSLLVGIAVGSALGAAGVAVFFMLKARGSAQILAAAQTAQQELQALRSEVTALRANLRTAEQSAVAAQTGRDSALAQVADLTKQVSAERARGEQTSRELSAVQQQLREATTRSAEREEAMRKSSPSARNRSAS